MLKKIISLTIFMNLFITFIFSQKPSCSFDSLYLTKIDIFFHSENYEKKSINTIMPKFQKEDCSCKMLIYSKIFDLLITKGLNIRDSIIINKPIYISGMIDTSSYESKLEYKRIKDYQFKNKLYYDFIELKEQYEKNVIKSYQNSSDKFLNKDIDN